MKIFLLFYTFGLFTYCLSFIDINDIFIYAYEICSYHGNPEIDINGNIKCECREGFITVDWEERTLVNSKLLCSYEKKKRFSAFFLSAFIPIGLDYLYLGRFWYFFSYLIFDIIFIFHSILYFLLKTKFKKDDKYNAISTKSVKDNKDTKENIQKNKNANQNKFLNICYVTNYIISTLWLLIWIINMSFMGLGLVKDSNGIYTFNDIHFLFKIEMN